MNGRDLGPGTVAKGMDREFHHEHHPGVEQRGQFAYDLGSKGLDQSVGGVLKLHKTVEWLNAGVLARVELIA
jgi:hypothetical protein